MVKLQRFLEHLQKRVSELTAAQTSREREQAKEFKRLQALLAHRKQEIQTIRANEVECAGSLYSGFRLLVST
jgi:hypothetical protein